MVKAVDRDPDKLYCDDLSLTQQHCKDECDINLIVERAIKQGVVTHVNSGQPMYGDVSQIPSYQEAFAIVKRAESLFMSLPWQARERFGNDPQRMLEFLKDDKNREEALKLGLLEVKKRDEALDALKSIDSSLKASSGAKPADSGPAGAGAAQ